MGNSKSKTKNKESGTAEKRQINQNNSIHSGETSPEMGTNEGASELGGGIVPGDVSKPRKAYSEPPLKSKLFKSNKLKNWSSKSVSFGTEFNEYSKKKKTPKNKSETKNENKNFLCEENLKIEKNKTPIKITKSDSKSFYNEEILKNKSLNITKNDMKSFKKEILSNFIEESKNKISNIESLIEALQNFNKIFDQFPQDYYRFVTKMLYLKTFFKTGESEENCAVVCKLLRENLWVLEKILPGLTEHSETVQRMTVTMARVEEKIESEGMICKEARECRKRGKRE